MFAVAILSADLLFIQVLIRLVGAEDHIYPNSLDVQQWLADSNLLEMIVDKLCPPVSKVEICHMSLYLLKFSSSNRSCQPVSS